MTLSIPHHCYWSQSNLCDGSETLTISAPARRHLPRQMYITTVLKDTFSGLEAGKVLSNRATNHETPPSGTLTLRPTLLLKLAGYKSHSYTRENQCSHAEQATINALTLTLLLFHLQFSKHVSVNFIVDPSSIFNSEHEIRHRALVHGRALRFFNNGHRLPFPFFLAVLLRGVQTAALLLSSALRPMGWLWLQERQCGETLCSAPISFSSHLPPQMTLVSSFLTFSASAFPLSRSFAQIGLRQ